jgi:thioredoxin 1
MEKLPDSPDYPVILNDNNIDEAIAKYPFLVVDCWAEWCGPCRMMGPIIDTLSSKHAGDIAFGKLDVDSNPKTSSTFGIMSIPNLLVFKNGEKVGSIIGAMPEDALIKKIGTYK